MHSYYIFNLYFMNMSSTLNKVQTNKQTNNILSSEYLYLECRQRMNADNPNLVKLLFSSVLNPNLILHRIKNYFIKKETLTELFSCEFSEIFKSTFLTEHVRASASEPRRIWTPCKASMMQYFLPKQLKASSFF